MYIFSEQDNTLKAMHIVCEHAAAINFSHYCKSLHTSCKMCMMVKFWCFFLFFVQKGRLHKRDHWNTNLQKKSFRWIGHCTVIPAKAHLLFIKAFFCCRLLRGQRPYWWVEECPLWRDGPPLKQFDITCETGPGNLQYFCETSPQVGVHTHTSCTVQTSTTTFFLLHQALTVALISCCFFAGKMYRIFCFKL